ncbi:probable secreted peptidase [Alloactinosynnema sp. L-07]|uniref:S8 family peptidase n=1 Tax=Alloactinosynnema sp. L-07 TaxID=1653480 RepID=UPI00065F00F7|nr:S8/S53 family peptidase [Alloactinosynnema sp. L-07]CRK60299.1 probable secreted peptidase [Alloactinosynnema sp. L-07]
MRYSPDRVTVSDVHIHELADRHPGLHLHDPGGPTESLIRRGELLVARSDLPRVEVALSRWIDRVEGPAVVRLRPDVDPVAIAADHPGLPISINHVHTVMVGSPILHGTGATPVPVPLPPAPAVEVWDTPVTVLILDTGVDAHPWFTDRPWFGEWGPHQEILDLDGDGVADQQAGHGTFVTGILLRHAPGATLRHHRVLTSHGLTDDRTVATALRRTREHAASVGEKIDIVVMTFGCHTPDDQCPPVLARELEKFGDTRFVAAAGNTATTRPFWPAAHPAVIAVGATTADGQPAPFSGRGPWVDTTAPGVDIVSAHVRLTPTTREYGAARWSGTSFAAPQVAAALATALHKGAPHSMV